LKLDNVPANLESVQCLVFQTSEVFDSSSGSKFVTGCRFTDTDFLYHAKISAVRFVCFSDFHCACQVSITRLFPV